MQSNKRLLKRLSNLFKFNFVITMVTIGSGCLSKLGWAWHLTVIYCWIISLNESVKTESVKTVKLSVHWTMYFLDFPSELKGSYKHCGSSVSGYEKSSSNLLGYLKVCIFLLNCFITMKLIAIRVIGNEWPCLVSHFLLITIAVFFTSFHKVN